MKLVDIEMLGLRPSTLANAQLNVASLVVAEEFRHCDDHVNYRETAINRLINMRVPFRSEHNILPKLIDRIMTIRCPYCESEMARERSGANGSESWFVMLCENCKAVLHLAIAEDCIGITPSLRADD